MCLLRRRLGEWRRDGHRRGRSKKRSKPVHGFGPISTPSALPTTGQAAAPLDSDAEQPLPEAPERFNLQAGSPASALPASFPSGPRYALMRRVHEANRLTTPFFRTVADARLLLLTLLALVSSS